MAGKKSRLRTKEDAAALVKRLREENKMTYYKLEKLTGVPHQNLPRIERGEGGVTVETLIKLLDAFGLELVAR